MEEMISLVDSCEDDYIKCLAAGALNKVDPGNPSITKALLEVFNSSEDDKFLATNSLMEISEINQLLQLVSTLKNYFNPELYKNNFSAYHDIYKILWHCAQNLTYKNFYNAWHN